MRINMKFKIPEKIIKIGYKKVGIGSCGLFVFALIYSYAIFPALLKAILKFKVALRPGGEMRGLWETVPFYLGFKIYIFNVTNPEEVTAGGKPILQEIGPYFFEEWKSKHEIEDDPEEDTATFYAHDTYIFRPDLSEGLTGNEIVTTLEPVLCSVALYINRERPPMLPLVSKAIDFMFTQSIPFLKTRAMDLLFDGYLIDCSSDEFSVKAVCSALESESARISRYNGTHLKFSLFQAFNATDKIKFTVYRGIKNVRNLGRVIRYNDEPEMEFWDEGPGNCNALRGSDGTVFPPFGAREDGIWAFVPAVCRGLCTTYEGKSSYAGLPAERYTLDFGDYSDENLHCYCADPPDDCPPRGVMDLFSCISAPFSVSLPHFFKCDPKLLEDVIGLNPQKEKHGVEVDFERTTGSPMRAMNRLQFSITMKNIPDIAMLSNMKNLEFPLLWVEEELALNKTFTNMLKYQYFLPKNLSAVFKTLMFLGSVTGMGLAGFLMNLKENEVRTVTPAEAEKPKDLEKNGNDDLDDEDLSDSKPGGGEINGSTKIHQILHADGLKNMQKF